MAFKLDDLIGKKKEPNQILDLSKIKIKSKEEFEKYFDKIPEFKVRPEKVRPEDVKIRDQDFSFSLTRKESRSRAKHEATYGDPIPQSMKSVRLEDLAAVDINWRMLTMARPKTKLEEDYFSRIVELGKLRIGTRRYEAKLQASTSQGLPAAQAQLLSLGIMICKNKRGGTETRIRSCKECGEELCNGKWCKEYPYDSYTRMMLDKDEMEKEEAEELGIRRVSTKPGDQPNKGKSNKAKGTTNKGKLGKKVRRKKKRKLKKKNLKKPGSSGSDSSSSSSDE